MRYSALIVVAVALALVTPVLGISTRPVHNELLDTFVPQPADLDAVPVEPTCVNHVNPDGTDPCPSGNPDEFADDRNDERFWRDGNGEVIAATPPGYECGLPDLSVTIQNPFPIFVPDGVDDPASQGVLVSYGSFYVIPEIVDNNGEDVGWDAEDVEAIWFGFLSTAPTVPGVVGPNDVCSATADAGIGVSGAYYEFYRGDTDPEDGWLIPINTLLVPDNIYGAILRVFGAPQAPGTGGLVPLTTSFVYAIVDNKGGNDEQWRSCTPTAVRCDFRDLQPPWPSITPGDVTLDQAGGGGKLVVEFGEYVNDGRHDSPRELDIEVDRGLGFQSVGWQAFNTPGRDVDSVPLFTVLTDEWGTRAEVLFPAGDELKPGDRVRVTAQDRHIDGGLIGNTATKTVTIS